MKRPTIQTTLVWSAIAVLCITGTIYEFPNAVSSLRRIRNVFSGPERSATTLVPDRLVAQDPEAGVILRYVLKHRYSDPNVSELRDLVAEHPQNEFFLSQLVEGLNRSKHADPNEALAVTDQLLAVNPDNAHAHYLRAWVQPRASIRRNGTLGAFEQADRVPEFYLPYGKYKDRVARLAGQAALPSDRRPWLYLLPYRSLGSRITSTTRWREMDRPSFHQLLPSAANMAARVVENAYDLASLRAGAELTEDVEKIRLRELDLTAVEAGQARQRLAQAIAISRWRDRRFSLTWHSGVPILPIAAWFSLAALVQNLILALLTKRKAWPDTAHLKLARRLRITSWAFVPIAWLALFVLHGWFRAEFWAALLLTCLWLMLWISWMGDAESLLSVRIVDAVGPRRSPWRSRTAQILFWLNGTLLLLLGNSTFFTSGSLAGWTQNIGVFAAWLAFCILLWLSMLRPRMSLRQPRRNRALVGAMYWAAALVAFDVWGAQCAYEHQIWANPLPAYGRIPVATQQTYERFIRDAGPLDDLDADGAHALPEYIRYFTAEDMEAFLARRRAEGRALSEEQLRSVLWRSARDVRPIIQATIDSRAVPETTAEQIHETETGP